MKRALLLAVTLPLVILGLLAGCKEKRAERVAESYSSVTKPSDPLPPAPRRAGPRAPDKLAVGLDSIPVEESYEERAASTISEANLQERVTELEKELSQ